MNTVKLNGQMLEAFRLKPGHKLLSVRGSHIGTSMISRDPLFEHAKKYPEIKHFA